MENVPLSQHSPTATPPAQFRPNPHPLSLSADPVPTAHAPTQEDRELFGYLFDKNGVPIPGATITTWEDSSDEDLDVLIEKATEGLIFETETALKACVFAVEQLRSVLDSRPDLHPQYAQRLQAIPVEPAQPLEFPKNTESEGSMPVVLARVKAVASLWESLEIQGLTSQEPTPGLTLNRFREIASNLADRTENLTELLWDQMFCSGPDED